MAYDSNNLSALTYANGFTLWHYKTSDSKDDIEADGYFKEASPVLRRGDVIMMNTSVDGDMVSGITFVSSNDGTTVKLG